VVYYVLHIAGQEYLARDLTMEVWTSDWLVSKSSHHYITVKPPKSLVQVFVTANVFLLLSLYYFYFIIIIIIIICPPAQSRGREN